MTGILLTRPIQDSLAIARSMQGKTIYLQPLLTIKERENFEKEVKNASQKALIFTSKHAAIIWAKHFYERKAKVFCVGEVTAQTCRNLGFQNIVTAGNNARSLLEMIAAEPLQGYLFPSGADVTMDFEEMLGQDTCRRVIVYQTNPALKLRPTILRAFEQKNIQQVILLSKKTALTFKNLLKKDYDFEVLGLSEDILSVFPEHAGKVINPEDELIF